jgi:hypothetical protein
MRCPHCDNHLLQKSGSRVRLRTQGPIDFDGKRCRAKCYWCASLVELPIQILDGTPISREQFILPRKRD